MKSLSTNYTKKNLFEFHEKTQLNQAIGLMRLAAGCLRPLWPGRRLLASGYFAVGFNRRNKSPQDLYGAHIVHKEQK
jgi:hypothetical protein